MILPGLHRLLRLRLGWADLLRRSVVEMYRDNCLGLAAQLAYYFFLALFPALLFVVALASFFPLEQTVPEVLEAARPFLPADVLTILREQIAKISQGHHGGILTFGLVAALWSSSAAMTAIIEALNRAYQVEEGRPWWRTRLTAIALTLALALLIVVSLALVLVGPAVIERLVPGVPGLLWAWSLARWPLAFALVALAIGLVYYFAPDVEQEWVWLTPGSLLATVTWIVASLAFKLYLSRFGTYTESYGAIGGVMVLLLWLYISGLAILVGAELNSEIEHASTEGKDRGEKAPGQLPRVTTESGDAVPIGELPRAAPEAPLVWASMASGALVAVGLLAGWLVRRPRLFPRR